MYQSMQVVFAFNIDIPNLTVLRLLHIEIRLIQININRSFLRGIYVCNTKYSVEIPKYSVEMKAEYWFILFHSQPENFLEIRNSDAFPIRKIFGNLKNVNSLLVVDKINPNSMSIYNIYKSIKNLYNSTKSTKFTIYLKLTKKIDITEDKMGILFTDKTQIVRTASF
ncbi:hypothetical protein V1477_021320 [Vespula maculifrons]|uniref:Uncharacterized protein n=1 Tax=Vespula maculifrons TaxID=7453 RepID=A0ABD2AHG4_VESMC